MKLQQNNKLEHIAYLAIFITLLYQYVFNLLLHQIYLSPFVYIKGSFLFLLVSLSNFPKLVLDNYNNALIFDVILLVSSLICVIKPNSKIFSFTFFVLFTLYYTTLFSSIAHHEHILIGTWLTSLVLCFNNTKDYNTIKDYLRLYTCFIMSSAAIWKILNGAIFNPLHLQNTVKFHNFSSIYYQLNSFNNKFILSLIQSEIFSIILWYSSFLLEFTFIIGFFTKKLDNFLVAIFILFFIMDYVLLGLEFWPLLILTLFFNSKLISKLD